MQRLEPALQALGLNVLLPLEAARFDAVAAPLRLGALLADAAGALIVGSGGRAFFEAFSAAPESRDGARHPLDRYTARVVSAAVGAALSGAGARYALAYPFDADPVIPFQRLGRAAGLGGPGPLALQIHPVFGPWWAYRALIVLDRAPPPGTAPPLGDACAGCPAPCVPACPAGAVRAAGFDVPACHARRSTAPDCRESCAARIACVRGPVHRYGDRQLAFHMRASLPRLA
jgi:epoxyqueuosine reductase